MPPANCLRPKLSFCLTLLGLTTASIAQQAPTAPRPTSGSASESETVVLTPFEVTSSKDNGYQATETLAGTRIRTNLADVGSAIQVITKEFLKDVGATDSSTLLQYTTNAEVAGTRGTYAGMGNGTSVDETGNLRNPSAAQRIRGLASADNTREFFVTDIPWDSYNVDRIDLQRGPNSILFGLGSPAGIVNASLNNASFRTAGSAEYRFGSYGTQRGSLDFNHALIDKVLAFRFAALTEHQLYQQEPAFQDQKRLYGTVRFDPKLFRNPSLHTSIKVKYEHGDIKANRPRTTPPQDSITPWFRPASADPNNLMGGMGKVVVSNGYNLGSSASTFNPWLSGLANQQQPVWFIDGTTNQTYRIYGGYVNTGALNAAGARQGAGVSLVGQRYADVFSQLGSFSSYANNARLTNYQFGQYRNMSLTDPTVFDYNNSLIDGPTKKEYEKWNAYNLDISQTAFGDRLGIQLSYDKQKYRRGGESLLGFQPTINIDILQNFQDYVIGSNNASNANVGNPNFGRPFVQAGPGRGSSYDSEREYVRGSIFGEVRSRDFVKSDFFAKLLGRHRFNGVYSGEKYNTENRGWQMYGNSAAYATFKTQGSPDGIQNLPPVAVVYLGPSVANANSASNAGISRVLSNVTLTDGNIYQFESTWRPQPGVNITDPWNVPTNLQAIFNGAPVVNPATGAAFPQLTQVSNPANYVGWNSNYNDGADLSLITAAAKSLRETKSYAGTWQGYFWNDAIVPTLGWRFDEVKSKNVSALPQGGAARGAFNLNPSVYKLPDTFPVNQIFKDHSTAGGVVVHLNRLLAGRDRLPLNVSLSYNKSNNFQVTDLRRDIYGNSISNPSGTTKDYGVRLSTKDGKYSFRAVKYESRLTGANTPLDNSGIYGTIRDAMNWRNIKTYYMSLYDWSSANQTDVRNFAGVRYMWDPAYVSTTTGRPVASGSLATGPAGSRLETQAEANLRRDASLKAINDMQVFLAGKGYFQAWNYGVGPTTQSALQTRGQFEANPTLPAPASVYDYRTAPLLQGFAVTADTQSKGHEFEFTANPLPNWRIAFNASETVAVRTNVGGKVLDELVAYMDTTMAGPAGDLVRFNSDYSAANELRQAWLPWRGQYTLLKLQENTAASELRKWRYNFVTNYTFRQGFLRNVGVGGSYRWQDKVVIGYPVIPGANGAASFDLTKPYYGPSEDAIDLWASYERKLTEKITWRVQLNVRNAFAKEGLIPISIEPDGRTWAAVRVKPNQEWFLTNTFSF